MRFRLFLDYCTLGGMPYVVRNYIERRSFEGSLASQRRIVRDYGDDIRKYAEGLDTVRILKVFNHIPAQLANETTIKFQISKVAHGARAREYAPCVDWLRDAGVANVCRRGDELIPLEVKGGNDSTKSLNEMIRSEKYPDVRWGIKMADANIGFADNKLTVPWFCAFLLDRYLGNDSNKADAVAWFDP